MPHTGINLENVKENNRSAILRLLNERGAMSRKDIAQELGLTAATVTLICSDLLATGVLKEQGALDEGPKVGRKKILVGIDYTCRYVLAVCLEINHICVTLSDLRGNLVHTRYLAADALDFQFSFLERVVQLCTEVLEATRLPRKRILGVGVSVHGSVDRASGVLNSAYRARPERIELAKLLQDRLELPVIVENNVKSFAEAELIYGRGKKNDNLLFLKWGPGIGSALVVHGKLYESHTSKEGELGHIIVEKDGKLCRCGRRGCLETKASIHAIAELVKQHCTAESMPLLFQRVDGCLDQITAQNLDYWIHAQDPVMMAVLDPIIELVARNACHSLTLLAPDTLIIYGPLFSVPQVRRRFLHFCKKYDPAYDENYISLSELNDRIDYIGPLAIVVNQRFFATGGAV